MSIGDLSLCGVPEEEDEEECVQSSASPNALPTAAAAARGGGGGPLTPRRRILPVTVANISIICALLCILFPNISNGAFSVYRLVFGTLYPAYASYKAVRSRDVREYVKWMMYWIVFALFTCGETITDVFLSFWFPFYYEIKIAFVLWLLSPATKGSSILYRKFVHPMLTNREQEIDEYIARAKEQGYHTVLHLGSKGVNYATNVIMQTAIKGGGGLVNQLRKSYSLSDLTDGGDSDPVMDVNRNGKDVEGLEYRGNRRTDRVDGPRSNRARGYSPRRSASGSARMEMYFPEVDLEVRQRRGASRSREPSVPLSHIRSSEDVSSGYASGDHFYEDAVQMEVDQASEDTASASGEGPLVRTASVSSTRSTRTKGATSTRAGSTSSTSSTAKKATQGEQNSLEGGSSSSEDEDFWSDSMDHITPFPDRTLLANDLNSPKTPQPVEIQSNLGEINQTPGIGVDSVNLNSVFLDKQISLQVAKVAESLSLEIDSESLNIKNSETLEKSLISDSSPELTKVVDSKSLIDSTKDSTVSSLSSSPNSLIDGNSSQSSNSSQPTVLEAKNSQVQVKDQSKESPSGCEKECPKHSSIFTSLSKSCIETERGGNIEKTVSLEASSLNVIGFDKPSQSLEENSSNDIQPMSNLPNLSAADHLEGVNEQSVEHQTGENVPKSEISSSKETPLLRGGKYNKPPAPVPPQNETLQKEILGEDDADEGAKAVHARLVLQRGIVRSLPDVGSTSSSESSVSSQVFLAVNPTKRSSSSVSSRSDLKPKYENAGAGKSQSGKDHQASGVALPRFLSGGRPHFGSLTSLFPFWHGGTSSEIPSIIIPGKLGQPAKTKDSGSCENREKVGKFDSQNESNSSGGKTDEQKNSDVSDKGSSGEERGREKSKKTFPIRQLSHSPTCSLAKHEF